MGENTFSHAVWLGRTSGQPDRFADNEQPDVLLTGMTHREEKYAEFPKTEIQEKSLPECYLWVTLSKCLESQQANGSSKPFSSCLILLVLMSTFCFLAYQSIVGTVEIQSFFFFYFLPIGLVKCFSFNVVISYTNLYLFSNLTMRLELLYLVFHKGLMEGDKETTLQHRFKDTVKPKTPWDLLIIKILFR